MNIAKAYFCRCLRKFTVPDMVLRPVLVLFDMATPSRFGKMFERCKPLYTDVSPWITSLSGPIALPYLFAWLLAGVFLLLLGQSASGLAAEGMECELNAAHIPDPPAQDPAVVQDELQITAESVERRPDGMHILHGDPELIRGDTQLRADRMEYNDVDEQVFLFGDVQYWSPDMFVRGVEGMADLSSENAAMDQVDYILRDADARGGARHMRTDFGVSTVLESATYTGCHGARPAWELSAEELYLDHQLNKATVKHALFRVRDVPVFYFPWLRFPLKRERTSGFLVPGYGNTNVHGMEFRTPYYWNIAPQMDATFTPRIFLDNNPMLMANFRYLLDRGSGHVDIEYLASDNSYQRRDRNRVRVRHQQRFSDEGRFYLNFNQISDKNYFRHFGDSIGLSSIHFLDQLAELEYTTTLFDGSRLHGAARIQAYQSASTEAAAKPYERLPQLLWDYRSAVTDRRPNYGVQGEVVWFDRARTETVGSNPTGNRIDLYPWLSYPFRSRWGFAVPKLGVRHTRYALRDSTHSDDTRTLPVLSLDAGLYFERMFSHAGARYKQTLDPRIFYLYVPSEDQQHPLFDTSEYTFGRQVLFYEDRFSGRDRVGDANQLSVALASSLLGAADGRSRGEIALGQIFYFRDRTVTLTETQQVRDSIASPLVGELVISPYRKWRLSSSIQWDPEDRDVNRGNIHFRYHPRSGSIFNLTYRHNEDVVDVDQLGISMAWPLFSKVTLVGRWNHSLEKAKMLDAFGGLEYRACCFSVRTVIRRFLSGAGGEYKNGFFLQFSLTGLTELGSGSVVDFLQSNIPGYEQSF